jgi:hypothetical protein
MRALSKWVTLLQPSSRNDYDLRPVRCPGRIKYPSGEFGFCPAIIDRREVMLDRAVHEVKCQRCGCLYTYRLNDQGDLVLLSMLELRFNHRG